MGTYSKIILSGSTDGQGIEIGASTVTGTVLHTAVTGAADSIDEIWIYAHAKVTTAVALNMLWGPTTATGTKFVHTITGDDRSGLILVAPGLPLRNAKIVKAFVTTANEVVIFGHAIRFAT